MSKVTIFSRQMPFGEHKKTFFVENILRLFDVDYKSEDYLKILFQLNRENLENNRITGWQIEHFYKTLEQDISAIPQKKHTIRDTKRFSIGDFTSPRIWTGVPYNSPQITFYHDLRVEDMYLLHIGSISGKTNQTKSFLSIGPWSKKHNVSKVALSYVDPKMFLHDSQKQQLAYNDGLLMPDFKQWFSINDEWHAGDLVPWKTYKIICFSKMNY